MRFTLRQLQVFVTVAQQESVSRAAGLLALSQSAASTSITELERQTSCQLFDRAGKRLSLNALGRQLLPQAVALLDQAKEIEDLLNGKSGFGSLTVGATLTIGNYLATLLIGSFMQAHPESQVKLIVQNTAHIVQQVAHYEIDLGLIEGDCSHPDIEVQSWVEDELVVFCAPQHPLAARGHATLEELSREAWILREQGSGTRLTFDQAMRHHQTSLNIRLELIWISLVNFSSSGTRRSTRPQQCASFWNCAAHLPQVFSAATRSCCRALLKAGSRPTPRQSA